MSHGMTTAGIGSLSRIRSRSISRIFVSMDKYSILHHSYKPKLKSILQRNPRHVKPPLVQHATAQKTQLPSSLVFRDGLLRVLISLVSDFSPSVNCSDTDTPSASTVYFERSQLSFKTQHRVPPTTKRETGLYTVFRLFSTTGTNIYSILIY